MYITYSHSSGAFKSLQSVFMSFMSAIQILLNQDKINNLIQKQKKTCLLRRCTNDQRTHEKMLKVSNR